MASAAATGWEAEYREAARNERFGGQRGGRGASAQSGEVQTIEARTDGGPFTDFQDFVDRVDLSALNRRTVESMIKAGAFDALGVSRKGLILTFEQVLESTISRRRKEDLSGDAQCHRRDRG